MILVDTSVWVRHFRESCSDLKKLLEEGDMLCHPFVIGEIACGYLKNRKEILKLLNALPQAPSLDLEEVLYFMHTENLYGKGVGLIDIHLLGSAQLSHAKLWTEDKRLKTLAKNLKIDFEI